MPWNRILIAIESWIQVPTRNKSNLNKNHTALLFSPILDSSNDTPTHSCVIFSRPAPKCVKIKRGEKLLEDPPESYEDDSEDDCDQVKYLPDNVTKYRYGMVPYRCQLPTSSAGRIRQLPPVPTTYLY